MNNTPSLKIKCFKNKAGLENQFNLAELNNQQTQILFVGASECKRAF